MTAGPVRNRARHSVRSGRRSPASEASQLKRWMPWLLVLLVVGGCDVRNAPPPDSRVEASPPPTAAPPAPEPSPKPAPPVEPSGSPAKAPDQARQELDKLLGKGDASASVAAAVGKLLPAFPWPPPRTTARYALPRDLATAQGRATTLGVVADHLEVALRSQGYTQLGYYGVPDGFALATQVEQIRDDGRPMPAPDRWEAELQPVSLANFSLETYLKALVMARRGYYRIIVFVASPHPFTEDLHQRLSRERAEELFHGGLSRLAEGLRPLPYGETYDLNALVYEFEQQVPGRPAKVRDPSPVTGEAHLRQASILMALARADLVR